MPEGWTGPIESTNKKIGFFFRKQIEKIPRKTKDRIHRLALGTGHFANCMKDLKNQGMGIDDVDRAAFERTFCCCGRWLGRCRLTHLGTTVVI